MLRIAGCDDMPEKLVRISQHKRSYSVMLCLCIALTLPLFSACAAISATPGPALEPAAALDSPYAVAGTEPSSFGVSVEVEVDGAVVDDYSRADQINFSPDEPYTAVDGIVTFRGDNFRSGASFGDAVVLNRMLSQAWVVDTGELGRSDVDGPTDRVWSGSGWVGQPLIVKWPASVKQHMNMYDWAKADDSLVEVIYATMDGNIYFLNLANGRATRDKLFLNRPFKGAGSLDPRGYPLMYLGSGDIYATDEQKSRAMVISLIDCTVLYEFGKQNDAFSLRDWHAYDSAPLLDARADTLIYPGENGILYTIKLNTQYDEAAGTISVNPTQIVKLRYKSGRSTYPASTNASDNRFWLGYESSASVLGGYAYLGTNDGFLQCIDFNTMEMVWVQDVQDDTNGSPVLELDIPNRAAYIYIGSSLHFTADSDMLGTVPFMKVNAITGEIIWKHEEQVSTRSGVSGGVQGTALLGKGAIADLVIIPFARTPSENAGMLMALDKMTGEVRWIFLMEKYTWSSPVAVYDTAGNAYIVVCEGSDTGGKVYLLDGRTGMLLNTFDAQANIEASPAVYGNTIVVGTRGRKIWGIHIK